MNRTYTSSQRLGFGVAAIALMVAPLAAQAEDDLVPTTDYEMWGSSDILETRAVINEEVSAAAWTSLDGESFGNVITSTGVSGFQMEAIVDNTGPTYMSNDFELNAPLTAVSATDIRGSSGDVTTVSTAVGARFAVGSFSGVPTGEGQ